MGGGQRCLGLSSKRHKGESRPDKMECQKRNKIRTRLYSNQILRSESLSRDGVSSILRNVLFDKSSLVDVPRLARHHRDLWGFPR